MRIAVISAAGNKTEIPEYVKSLARGMELMGHRVDIIDASAGDGSRLAGYEYIAVCAETVSFISARLPPSVSKILSVASSLAGRKSAAFIKKTGPLFMNRALANLMKSMEKEGMVINWSDFILSAPHAETLGKRIGA